MRSTSHRVPSGHGEAVVRAAAKQLRSGIPACWTWPLPAEVEGDPRERMMLMGEWQEDRCATCGRVAPYDLVTDHDHETGLVRGYLCKSCNTLESHDGKPVFDRYRLINPASICQFEWMYAPPLPVLVLTEAGEEPIRRALDAAVQKALA
jgi:Recombination endonuclease VII